MCVTGIIGLPLEESEVSMAKKWGGVSVTAGVSNTGVTSKAKEHSATVSCIG